MSCCCAEFRAAAEEPKALGLDRIKTSLFKTESSRKKCERYHNKTEKQECLPQDAKHRRTRRDLLHAEYVEGQKGGGLGQPEAGFKVSLLHA